MRAKIKAYLPALLCALTPVVCYLVAHPYAEIGISDDWSYVKSAQVLAETGHIAYTGWSNPMLGWQLYFGALFVKLFGFSFTAVRLSILLEATAAAFLMQRTMVRAGINEWNATLATLAFVLSPLYLSLAFIFMSEVSGVLSIVLCLYMCLRAVGTKNQRSASMWIVAAALLNAVGGTARQIVWLGVLVMVPSALWLLRRCRRVLAAGALACAAGFCFIFAAMHWFALQPYSVPESLFPGRIDWSFVKHLGSAFLTAIRALPWLLAPLLLMFMAPLRKRSRRCVPVIAATSLFYGLLRLLYHVMSVSAQSAGQVAGRAGIAAALAAFHNLGSLAVSGDLADIADYGVRLLRASATAMALLTIVFYAVLCARGRPTFEKTDDGISWRKLATVLGPFTLAYILLLAPRAAEGEFYDRYVLPLLVVCLVAFTRYYQERVRTKLPVACALLIGAIGLYSLTILHDEFALYRGYATAINEVRSSGVPATAILGPWEFDGWTEVDAAGYFDDPRIRVPMDAYRPPPKDFSVPGCVDDLPGSAGWALAETPAIKPVYGISFNPQDCDGPARFTPVLYRTWLPPRVSSIYVVKMPASMSQ